MPNSKGNPMCAVVETVTNAHHIPVTSLRQGSDVTNEEDDVSFENRPLRRPAAPSLVRKPNFRAPPVVRNQNLGPPAPPQSRNKGSVVGNQLLGTAPSLVRKKNLSRTNPNLVKPTR